ncbi:hypothetical protein [Clostridium cellulovorans]|uniref:Uncharacterized protein n=1 Tax=Clostridium cellulovorans (strain ATCC 35296 / DSM 3052 / OCM 3 / 743B) TaxID=573061 RepID=D9SUW2_CLOC7|nr:hypothetical protein [Clostridium cellulovorans]ADL51017.1 hypothetical protein Clocel_1262 [Clostridium cellulovorans 743B]
MKDNNIQNKYKNFMQFLELVSANELNYFILDSKFKEGFNQRMKGLSREVKEAFDGELRIVFNTNDEVAIIDSTVLSTYIADLYRRSMEAKYKGNRIDEIIKKTCDSGEMVKTSFLKVSYRSLYESFDSVYKEIAYRKQHLENNKKYFGVENYKKSDAAIVILTLMVLEDISKYISVKRNVLMDVIKEVVDY